MRTLVIATFKTPYEADGTYRTLRETDPGVLGAPGDAAVVVVDEDRTVRINGTVHSAFPLALGGGFVGVLAGLIITNPVLALIGGIGGAGLGAIVGALKEVGIDEGLMARLSKKLTPGSSALFVLAPRNDATAVVKLLAPHSRNVLQVKLAHADEEMLSAALRKAEIAGA